MLKETDGHLFGMVILHTNFHTGGLNQPELVDGQQRMTTLIILLKAIRDIFMEFGKSEKVTEIDNMLSCKGLDDVRRPKIRLGELDNNDIESLLIHNDVNSVSNINIRSAYNYYKTWLLEKKSFEEVNKFFFKVTNIAVIIRLDVGMAQDAYKLFETINNRGLKLTPTDIIKNFLLGHAAKINTDNTLEKVKGLWSEIITNLDGIDTDDFLRHFMCAILMRRISLTKLTYEFKRYYLKNIKHAELLGEYGYYELEFPEDEENPKDDHQNEVAIKEKKINLVDFLTNLRELSRTYQRISRNDFKDVKINRRVSNLNFILSKPSYIFLMHFLQEESYSQKEKLEVLKYFESLMLRRHICEQKTNENDDIFSKLVAFIGEPNILSRIRAFITESEFMPEDEDFALSFSKYHFKGKLIDRAKYILATIEYKLRDNTYELIVASSGEVELEHIIPQVIDTKRSKEEYGDWEEYLGAHAQAKHKKHVHLIGNMTLLGEALNIQAYNNPFAKKKTSYKKSSFLITSTLAEASDFRFGNVVKRGEYYSELARDIWKS
jgi:uncharacterized protein with ParB-like and HNH nuclease domain